MDIDPSSGIPGIPPYFTQTPQGWGWYVDRYDAPPAQTIDATSDLMDQDADFSYRATYQRNTQPAYDPYTIVDADWPGGPTNALMPAPGDGALPPMTRRSSRKPTTTRTTWIAATRTPTGRR